MGWRCSQSRRTGRCRMGRSPARGPIWHVRGSRQFAWPPSGRAAVPMAAIAQLKKSHSSLPATPSTCCSPISGRAATGLGMVVGGVERRSARRLPQLCGRLVACSAGFAVGFVMASWYPPPMAGGGRPKGFAIGQRSTSYSSGAIETVPSASWQASRRGLAFRLGTHGLMAFTRFATATNSIRSDHHRSRRIGCLLRTPGRPWRRV